MPDERRLLKKLGSGRPAARYDACEELRVAARISGEAMAALEATLHDEDPLVVDAAKRALAMHMHPQSPTSQVPTGQAAPGHGRRLRWWFVPLGFLVFCLTAWLVRILVFQIRYGGMPIAAITVGFPPDCVWSATGVAWVDQNANGTRDVGEPPLEGVHFRVYDTTRGNAEVGSRAITDWYGRTTLLVWLPGCPSAKFSVGAEPPEGYLPIVDAPIPIEGSGYGSDAPIDLGFVRVAGYPSPTPYIPGLECTLYPIEAEDFAMASDLRIWAASWHGAAQYSPEGDTWHTLPELPEQAGLVEGIDIHPSGQVALRSYNSVAHLEDGHWRLTEYDFRSIDNLVPSFGASADGTLWYAVAAPPDMLVSFNPHTALWHLYGPSSRADSALEAIILELPGARYASFRYGPSTPETAPVLPDGWTISHQRTFSPADFVSIPLEGWIEDAELASDGTIWVAHSFGISSFNPASRAYMAYIPADALDYLPPIKDIALAPDGSLWAVAEDAHPLLLHLRPTSNSAERPRWTVFDPRDGFPDDTSLRAVAVAVSGDVWLGYGSSNRTARCTPIDG